MTAKPEPNATTQSAPNAAESTETVHGTADGIASPSSNGRSPDRERTPERTSGRSRGLLRPSIRSATSQPPHPQPPSDLTSTSTYLSPDFAQSLSWQRSQLTITAIAIAMIGLGLIWEHSVGFWLALSGALVAAVVSLRVLAPAMRYVWVEVIPASLRTASVAVVGLLAAVLSFLELSRGGQTIAGWLRRIDWDIAGALGEIGGAVGQILIAILAVYVAWRQYVISIDLTIQQNRITQQQTIDAYFQGVSDLALNEEGLLEDWPQERAIAEGRTAAILSSVDAEGKAKIIRFLSQSRLLTPLMRDRHLGRPMLDGMGGYAEDRMNGLRVIDLGVMLAGANLAGTDLRWTDLSESNLVRASLSGADLVKANLSRTILYEADLSGADLKAARLFYGKAETASPRSRTERPDYQTGAYTGAVVENADFTAVQRMSESQRYYCCAWGGEASRATIPGGCEGIPNKLGR